MKKMMTLFKKKPGMSVDDFRTYYEEKHTKLVMRLLKSGVSYKRNYIIKAGDGAVSHQVDGENVPPYDVITEVYFADDADYETLRKAMSDPEIARQVAEDEANFLDRPSMMVFFVDERETPPEVLRSYKD